MAAHPTFFDFNDCELSITKLNSESLLQFALSFEKKYEKVK